MKKIVIALLFLIVFSTAAFAVEIEYISPTGVSQRMISKHLYEVQQNNLNHFVTTPGLTFTTTTPNVANAAPYVYDGVFGTAVSGLITMTGATVEVSTTQLYGIEYNTTTSTSEVLTATPGETNPEKIGWTISSKIPLGYIKVITDSTHEFVPGTTAFDDTGITSTFYSYGFRPTIIKVLNNSR